MVRHKIVISIIDVSVLENYHIAQTFGLMGSQNSTKKRIDKKSINIPDFAGVF
jgi:hypothetical protein